AEDGDYDTCDDRRPDDDERPLSRGHSRRQRQNDRRQPHRVYNGEERHEIFDKKRHHTDDYIPRGAATPASPPCVGEGPGEGSLPSDAANSASRAAASSSAGRVSACVSSPAGKVSACSSKSFRIASRASGVVSAGA